MPELRTFLMIAVGAGALAFNGHSLFANPRVDESDRAGGAEVQAQLEAMRKQLETIQQENQSMKTEIDELRAKTDADWLTEARANEIRGLVADVLADADSRASLLQDGMMAGWSEHFFLADAYGRFKLVMEGMMQFRFVYNYVDRVSPFPPEDQHRNGFENTRTRLVFRGFVFSPDIEYLIRSEFARSGGGASLLDAWIRYNWNDEWSLRIGQFKLPFNREELVSPAEQLAVERSLVNEVMNLGRSQGVELTYASGPSRFAFAYSDGSNRPNQPALTLDSEYSFTARYEHLIAGNWGQFSDFTSPPDDEYGMMFGIGGFAEESESTGSFSFAQSTLRRVGGTIDLSIEWGGANFFASVIQHYFDNPPPQSFFDIDLGVLHLTGIVVQAGVYVAPKWEIFARGEYGQVSGDGGSQFDTSDLNLVTFGFNYYIEGHDLKWTTDIGITTEEIISTWASDLAGYRTMLPESDVQVVFRSQFQLLF